VANACLEFLQGQHLQDNAGRSGQHLKAGLDELLGRHALVGHFHGRGLFYSVDLVTDRNSMTPAKLAARWVCERMKALGVLVSSTGPLGNIIKIRPPLAFSVSDASKCLTALDAALMEMPADLRVSSIRSEHGRSMQA
jgi:4-aminobutyrate aminotransferase-like enzyme